MIDVRDHERSLATIRDAKRRFESGGGVLTATRRLVVELADALADSGPLELGIPAKQWLQAHCRLKRPSRRSGTIGSRSNYAQRPVG